MKLIKHDIEAKAFKGTVEIAVPSFPERMVHQKQILAYSKDEEGGGVALMGYLYEVVKSGVKSWDIETIHGEKIRSFEDLEYFSEITDLINEIGTLICQGIRLGK